MAESLRRAALGGLILDPEIRRAAFAAAPPLVRLGWLVARRAAHIRARRRWRRIVPGLATASLGAAAVAYVLTRKRSTGESAGGRSS